MLSSLVSVDTDKCVNCHACVSVCPVDYCNIACGDTVEINNNLCIGCGSCIKACTHEAREGIDDSSLFFRMLEEGAPFIGIVAPAVAAQFPELYRNFNGWLHTLGVEALFDVSLGAELTVKSYLEYITENNPKAVISQPCPAVVSYIEIYKPQLLPYLIPVDSPMLHTIKMVRNYWPGFKNHNLVVLSPCLAKKREFDDAFPGALNVTFASLKKYMEENNIDLRDYEEKEFSNPSAERAVVFSTPGGLLTTALRENPALKEGTRKIEGPGQLYEYLEKLPHMIEKGMNPLLIDCLNCEKGCNGGTGTTNGDKSPDELEYYINNRRREKQERYGKKGLSAVFGRQKLKGLLKRYWTKDLYTREYKNRTELKEIKHPTSGQLKKIYESMHKYSPEHFYNCSSCGYGSCEKMGVAIFNNLNKAENCHYYKECRIKEIQNQRCDDQKLFTRKTKEQIARVGQRLITMIVENQDEFQSLIVHLTKANDVTEKFKEILTTLKRLADQTNILSLNAGIEAVHVGSRGDGFAVVAREIRALADRTRQEALKMAPHTRSIKDLFSVIEEKTNTMALAFEEESRLAREEIERAMASTDL